MPKLKILSGGDIIKIFERFNFSVVAQKGSHVKLKRFFNESNQTLTIPNHRELDRGTIKAIYNQALKYISECVVAQQKLSRCIGRVFVVDPAGFAPAFLLTKGRVLLHELRARVHWIMVKQKKPSFKDLFCLASSESVVSYEPYLCVYCTPSSFCVNTLLSTPRAPAQSGGGRGD